MLALQVVVMRRDPFVRHLEVPVGNGFFDLLCKLDLPALEHEPSARHVDGGPPTCLWCMARRWPSWPFGTRTLSR